MVGTLRGWCSNYIIALDLLRGEEVVGNQVKVEECTGMV